MNQMMNENRNKDIKLLNQPRMDRSHDFKKRMNIKRRTDREGMDEVERLKWRKVPEKERASRKPEWEELSNRWDSEVCSRLEKEQREALEKDGKTNGSKYVDITKTSLYSYGVERNKRELGKKV